jgi:hypothetical protein
MLPTLINRFGSVLNLLTDMENKASLVYELQLYGSDERSSLQYHLCEEIGKVHPPKFYQQTLAQRIAHDCVMTKNMVLLFLNRVTRLEEATSCDAKSDLAHMLASFRKWGLLLVELCCSVNHGGHFLLLVHHDSQDYLVQSYYGEYLPRCEELSDPEAFLTSLCQADKSAFWQKYVRVPLTNPITEARECKEYVRGYFYQSSWCSPDELRKELLWREWENMEEFDHDDLKREVEELLVFIETVATPAE